jgi:hypothetical protein
VFTVFFAGVRGVKEFVFQKKTGFLLISCPLVDLFSGVA